METSENLVKVEEPNSGFLSAAELVQIRKSNEAPTRSSKGEKFYVRQNNWMESEAVDCALENYTDALKQNRAARKCDLMQAEWNKERNVSIAPYIRGKFLQHMGSAYSYEEVALSPEESIFLLQNGCIEILNGKMPLSTEEAYKIMLKEEMSTEKYQVYSQLSQLGFIVVRHREHLITQTADSSKLPSKRKRKSSTEAQREPQKKRTSFLGAFSNLPDATAHLAKEGNYVPETASEVEIATDVSQECITIAMTPSPSADHEVPNSSTTYPDETCIIVDPNVVTVDDSNHSSLEVNDKEEKLVPESVSSDVNNLGEPNALPSANGPIEGDGPGLSVEVSAEIITALNHESVSEKEVSVQSEHSNPAPCCSTNSNNVAVDLIVEGSEKISTTVSSSEVSPCKDVPVQMEDSESCSATNVNSAPLNFEAAVSRFEEVSKETKNTVEKDLSSKGISVQIEDSESCSDAISNTATSNFKDEVGVSEESIKEINVAANNNENFSSKEISVQIEDSESCDVNSNPAPSNLKADVIVPEEASKKVNNGLENNTGVCSEEIPVQIEDSNSSNEPKSNFEAAVRVSNNAIDIMNLDSDDTEISCSSEALGNEVSDSNVNKDWRMDAIGYYEESNSDESNSDVMSCSSNSEEDDVLSVGDEKLDEEEEVELLAVTKKEKKPLAVIDLLDSDASAASDICESEDDDIQVVKVCEGVRQNPRASVIHAPVPMKCKKEEKSSVNNSCSRLEVKFPNCAHQEIVAVSRPPSMYLPPNVALAKESYTLTFPPCAAQSRRVWNSYRELQSYRHNQRTEGFHSRNSGSNYRHGRFDSSGSYNNSNTWNQNSAPNTLTTNSAPWLNPVRNSNQRNSPQGFSHFQSSFPRTDRNHDTLSPESRSSNRRPSELPELLPNTNPFNMMPSFQNQFRYPPPNATAINSVVSVSNQDMNVSMVGNHILHPPRPPILPVGNLDHMDLMTAVQRTAYNVASDVLSSMFGSNPHMMPAMPPYGAFSTAMNGNLFGMPPPPNQPFVSLPSFGSLSNRRREQVRRNHTSNPFPCQYKNVGNRRSWNEVREAVGEQDMELDVGSDVEEVPLTPKDALWDPSGICPLVKPGVKHPPAEVLKKLQITKMANLRSNNPSNRMCLPKTCSLEISYDVYLPGTNYRKTSPGIPKHRIVVVRATDPLPKYADIVFLQKKWNDGATLQIAVVDGGDISFQSFNSVSLNALVPHE